MKAFIKRYRCFFSWRWLILVVGVANPEIASNLNLTKQNLIESCRHPADLRSCWPSSSYGSTGGAMISTTGKGSRHKGS